MFSINFDITEYFSFLFEVRYIESLLYFNFDEI